jgi:hypothetical protein
VVANQCHQAATDDASGKEKQKRRTEKVLIYLTNFALLRVEADVAQSVEQRIRNAVRFRSSAPVFNVESIVDHYFFFWKDKDINLLTLGSPTLARNTCSPEVEHYAIVIGHRTKPLTVTILLRNQSD